MGEIKGFIMSLVTAAAASALIDGFIPEGGIKKYVKYLTALVILLVLISPLRELIGAVPSLATGEFYYDSVETVSRANSIVAMHIEKALYEKFSLSDGELEARYDGERIVVRARSKPWLIASDIVTYVAHNFGVETEVIFYE